MARLDATSRACGRGRRRAVRGRWANGSSQTGPQARGAKCRMPPTTRQA